MTASSRAQRGSISSVEAFVLAVMAAIVVAIAIPSYIGMRDRANDSTARAEVRRAVDAIETHKAERGTYAISGPAILERYDSDVNSSRIEVVSAKRSSYCIQANVGGRTWHQAGPAGDLDGGACP